MIIDFMKYVLIRSLYHPSDTPPKPWEMYRRSVKLLKLDELM